MSVKGRPEVINVINRDQPQNAEVDHLHTPGTAGEFGKVINVINLKPEIGETEGGGGHWEGRSPLEVDHVDHSIDGLSKSPRSSAANGKNFSDQPRSERSITGCSEVDHLAFVVPIRTYSANHGQGREHWAARARRVKKERQAVALLWPKRNRIILPATVILTRMKPNGQPLDDDNLRGALKAVRDEVAKQLQVDDGDRELVQFTYSEEKGPWGVRIEIREAS